MKNISLPTLYLGMILLVAAVVPGYSTTYTVQVGNYFFNPQTITNVNPGDTIHWVWVTGTHTTTSTTIPAGAATWDEPITSSSPTYDYIPTVPGTYNYKCTPHAGMGMVGSFTVNAAAPLTVTALATPADVCMMSSSFVSCSPEGGSGSYTYSWVSNPPGFTSNQQSFTATPMQTTTYTVTVTSGTQNASASTTVTVQAPCSVMCQNDTSYCNDVPSFPVTATASNFSSLAWTTLGDGTFENAGALTAIYTPGPGDIAAGMVDLMCEVTPMGPCTIPSSDMVSVTLESCTGINNNRSGTLSLTVYPNPSSGEFRLKAGTLSGTASLNIFDMQGRVVYSAPFAPGESGLSVSGFAPGIYQAAVTEGENRGTVRILVR